MAVLDRAVPGWTGRDCSRATQSQALLCTLQAGHCWRCLTGSILLASVSLGHLATSAPWNLLEPPGKCQAQGDRLAGLSAGPRLGLVKPGGLWGGVCSCLAVVTGDCSTEVGPTAQDTCMWVTCGIVELCDLFPLATPSKMLESGLGLGSPEMRGDF